MSTVVAHDERATLISAGFAVLAAFVAVAASTMASLLALAVGVLGLLGFVAGLARGSRRGSMAGIGMIVIGLILGGLFGTQIELLLVGMIGVMLAWDLGQQAISLGVQIGRPGVDPAVELVHAAFALVIGVGIAILVVAIFVLVPDGQPMSALIFILAGGIVAAWIVRL